MNLRVYVLLMLLIHVAVVKGQVLDVNFNDNITDQASGFDPIYIIGEVEEAFDKITFVDGVEDRGVYLDSASGFKLPIEVTTELRNSTLWVIKMRFKIPAGDWANTSRRLLDLHRAGGASSSPFFRMYTYGWRDQLGLQFLMDDGAGDRPRISGPIFDYDEWVNLTFTIDFENLTYTILTDSYYGTGSFNFDFESFMTKWISQSVQHQEMYIGYYEGLAAQQAGAYPTRNAIGLVVDHFSVSTTVPETDLNAYKDALFQLTEHLNDNIVLTDHEITNYVTLALSNFDGQYLDAKAWVDNYLSAYEATHDPMFDLEKSYSLVYSDYDNFTWVAFNLQLDIFDNYVNNEHLDSVLGISFETAQAFPGPVSDDAVRLNDESIPINGTYIADPGYDRKVLEDDYGAFARRGTGLYAPPGELITVNVPVQLAGIGATIIIGTHSMDVRNKVGTGITRFPVIMKEFEIYQKEMRVLNPMGGIIYIGIPEGTDLGPIDVTISGAVKFAYYENSSTRQSDIDEFYALRDAEPTLWCEAVTDNAMFTAENVFFSRNDLAETMEMYDKMWEAYQTAFGRPLSLHKAEHLTHDQISKYNTLAGGYPMVLTWDQTPHSGSFWVNSGSNMLNVLDTEDYEQYKEDSKVTYWHEMSHHTALPTINNPVNENETIVGLGYVIAFHEGFGLPLDTAMKYSERRHVTRDEAIIDWVVLDNFHNNEEMATNERFYKQRGWSKYVDVAAMFGWEGFGSINKVFYDQWTAIGGQINDPDLNLITDSEWHLASNQALNQNMAPLNHFWGELPHDTLVATLNEFPRSLKVYSRLRYIRDFIPTTFEEFEPYYNKLAGDPASEHYQNAYDDWDGTYTRIIDQIDRILEEYYGSDFDQDGYTFLEDCDDTDPAINPDGATYDIEACGTYEFDGELLDTSGTYNATFTSVIGCDSLVNINLTVVTEFNETISIETCESYEFDGNILASSGNYNGAFTSKNGCDSLVTLNLTILEPNSGEETISSCGSYQWNGVDYAVSGTFQQTLTNVSGCDSLATLNLTILELTTSLETITICDSYEWNGTTFATSGVFREYFTNAAGCDSTAVLDLTILKSTFSETTVESCESYDWNGVTYDASGVYEELFTNAVGCDSTVTLHLTILEPSDGEETVAVCESYEWEGETYTVSGSHEKILVNRVGCDSTATLHLTILESTFSEETTGRCGSYNWNGESYTSSGTYEKLFTNTAGCDSTATLHLTILESTFSEETTGSCGSYNWNGESYTSSGIYKKLFTNTAGCDSTATLNLTILDPGSGEETITICESYEWEGETYAASGSYEKVLVNRVGCDSIATLHLTILESTFSEETIERCESYNWNGESYTSSGTYEKLFMNAAGCDSTATLNLTILEATSSEETVEACESYDWNGMTYEASGVYQIPFTNSAGCDSTAMLNLTIVLQPDEVVVSESACKSYQFDESLLTSSGEYTATFTNKAGCDSLVTLSLTILESTTSEEHIEACGSYKWNESTYTTSGIYHEMFTNAAGCDSTAILNLTILESDTCLPLSTTDATTDITISPNPTRGLIYVQGVENKTRYNLSDLSGRVIQEGLIEDSKLTVNAEAGAYFLSIPSMKIIVRVIIIE